MPLVPSIDVARPSAASVAALDAACRDHGFFLLEGHGLDDLIERTWQQTRTFFATSAANKRAVMRSEAAPLGYYDRELTKRRRDHKEVFDFVGPRGAGESDPNRWPADPPVFRDTLLELFAALGELAAQTLLLVHQGLDLAGAESAAYCGSTPTSSMRLNHYPVGDPVPDAERTGLPELGEMALGFHTDPGVITLLLQDDTGGLQTHSRAHGWIDVPPRPGTIVVNLGDVVQVWSNDRYRASVHRVVPMTRQSRYSIPYFYNPDANARIEPIAGLCQPAPVYRPFVWRELMKARIDDNYSDLGSEDTQISHYRVDRAAP